MDFYVEFNFTVSGTTVKLKSINHKLNGNIRTIYHYDIKNKTGLP